MNIDKNMIKSFLYFKLSYLIKNNISNKIIFFGEHPDQNWNQ